MGKKKKKKSLMINDELLFEIFLKKISKILNCVAKK